ncbi:MAG: hypothetical protein UH963_01440 [Agathobacter sp.]|nr:hypothetical protein [Agathobacter sp.]
MLITFAKFTDMVDKPKKEFFIKKIAVRNKVMLRLIVILNKIFMVRLFQQQITGL